MINVVVSGLAFNSKNMTSFLNVGVSYISHKSIETKTVEGCFWPNYHCRGKEQKINTIDSGKWHRSLTSDFS